MTSPTTHPPLQAPNQTPAPTPILETGDRLSRAEFERRYDATHGLKRAELIEGVVYVAAAVRAQHHGQPHGLMLLWLGTYCAATPGVEFAADSSIRLDLDNEPQPDAVMWIDTPAGQARIDNDGYLAGSPELCIEIAASSAGIDLHEKFRIYRRNGVREYLVWRVLDHAIDWFVLHDGDYQPMTPASENGKPGVLRSTVYPGLWLDVPATLNRDKPAMLACLQQGLATPEHAAFAKHLAESRA